MNSYDLIDQDTLLSIIQSQDFSYNLNPENLAEISENFDSDFELDLERIDGIIQKMQANQNIDSESIFSILESLLLSYEQIDPQTLSTIIQLIDLNNQIDSQTLDYLLQNINSETQVDSNELVSALDGFVYDNQGFSGTDIDYESLALALFSAYEDENLGQNLGSEEIPGWTKTLAVYFSDGQIQPLELESVTVDCSAESFREKIDFKNLDNMFDLWASSLPICAITQMP